MNSLLPTDDLLGHSTDLAYRAACAPLGVSLELCSNSAEVIGAAEQACSYWDGMNPAQQDQPALRLDIIVHGSAESGALPLPFIFRAYGPTFVAASGENLLTAQTDRGYGLAFITPALAADGENLRYNVLECLALLLASHRDRTPVHAAAVVRGGCAVLLVGPSGAGKSTLCYACVRAGFTLLAEDAVYVSLERGLRLWGNPGRIHLLPDAPRLFPELADLAPQVQANGKRKLAVALRAEQRSAPYVEQALVCFVERAEGRASRCEPVDVDAARALLSHPREPGFDLLRAQAPAVAEALTAQGAYRLSAGSDPRTAVALLEHLTER